MAWNGLSILNALAGGPLMMRQIAASLGEPSRNLSGCLRTLRNRGLIVSAEGVHQITEAGRAALASGQEITSAPCNGKATSRQANTLRARAWRFIRIRDGFSLDDLLSTLCDGSETDAEGNICSYLLALEIAGYLLPLPRRGEGGALRWRLRRDKDTGPEAPAWNKKTRILRDHNTGEAFTIRRKRGAAHA